MSEASAAQDYFDPPDWYFSAMVAAGCADTCASYCPTGHDDCENDDICAGGSGVWHECGGPEHYSYDEEPDLGDGGL